MDLKTRVLSGLRWSAGLRLLGQLATWGVTIIVIRLLNPADYGLMGMAEVFISFLAIINTHGPGSAIVQRHDLSEDDLRSVYGFILILSAAFFVLLYATAPWIADFYREEKLTAIIRVLAATFFCSGINLIPYALMTRDMEYRKIAVIDFGSALAGSATTLICAYLGMRVWSLVAGFMAMRLYTMIAIQIARPFWKTPRLRMQGIKALIAFSVRITVASILWYIYVNAAATTIVGRVLGKDILGIYAVGIYLACLPMEKVSGIINMVAFPAFSSIQNDANLAGAHFLKAVRILSLFAFPVFFGISSVADEIVAIFLGSKWISAVLPIQIIALTVPLRMVRNLLAPAANGLGRSDITLRIEIVAVIAIPVAFLAGSYYGLLGVCLVWVTAFPLVALVNLMQFVGVFGISVTGVLRMMLKPFLSGVVMFSAVTLVKSVIGVDISMNLKLALLCTVGAAVYGALAWAINRPTIRELMHLAKA
jgi:teichuronic acid exporter